MSGFWGKHFKKMAFTKQRHLRQNIFKFEPGKLFTCHIKHTLCVQYFE